MYQDVSIGSSELAIPGTPYQSGLLQIRYCVPRIPGAFTSGLFNALVGEYTWLHKIEYLKKVEIMRVER
jgi:hypothetical protein